MSCSSCMIFQGSAELTLMPYHRLMMMAMYTVFSMFNRS
jgi:hypothetical protein